MFLHSEPQNNLVAVLFRSIAPESSPTRCKSNSVRHFLFNVFFDFTATIPSYHALELLPRNLAIFAERNFRDEEKSSTYPHLCTCYAKNANKKFLPVKISSLEVHPEIPDKIPHFWRQLFDWIFVMYLNKGGKSNNPGQKKEAGTQAKMQIRIKF